MSFASKILRRTTDRIVFCITEPGQGDIDYFSYLLAVPTQRQQQFQDAMKSDAINLRDYGDVLYYGAGLLSDARIEELLQSA